VRLVLALMGFVLARPVVLLAACHDGEAVAIARAAIAAGCDCAVARKPGAYLRCARAVVAERIGSGLLPRTCHAAALRCAARAHCGGRGHAAAPCGTTSSTAPSSTTTTTTTTATTEPTSTTTTTAAPRCGNGVIDPGEMCDGESFCQQCAIPIVACCQIGGCSATITPVGEGCIAAGGTEIIGVGGGGGGPCPVPGLSGFAAGGCTEPVQVTPTSFCCPLSGGGCVTTPIATSADAVVAVFSCAIGGGDPTASPSLGTCGPGDVCIPAH
jgi:hypothetical protein